MQSKNQQNFYSLRGDADGLGGFFEQPVQKPIPTHVPVSLPPVGGLVVARAGAFNVDELVSSSSAFTHASGRQNTDGSASILVTSVVRDLDILEIVTAKLIVTQLALKLPTEQDQCIEVSFAGTVFVGLRIAGQKCHPRLNPDLQPLHRANGLVTWEDARRVGGTQGQALLNSLADRRDGYAYQWAQRRQQQLAADSQSAAKGPVRCSLIDSLEIPGASCGPIIEIPEFGTIFLGEVLYGPNSVQLVGVRAELGCAVSGRITSNEVGGGGEYD